MATDADAGMARRLSVAVGSAGNVRVEVEAPPGASWADAVAELWAGVAAVKADDAERRANGTGRRTGPTRPSAESLVGKVLRH